MESGSSTARCDTGHFDIYLGEAFEAIVTDQPAFLARHVPVVNDSRAGLR